MITMPDKRDDFQTAKGEDFQEFHKIQESGDPQKCELSDFSPNAPEMKSGESKGKK